MTDEIFWEEFLPIQNKLYRMSSGNAETVLPAIAADLVKQGKLTEKDYAVIYKIWDTRNRIVNDKNSSKPIVDEKVLAILKYAQKQLGIA